MYAIVEHFDVLKDILPGFGSRVMVPVVNRMARIKAARECADQGTGTQKPA
jgi:hypothetical protein